MDVAAPTQAGWEGKGPIKSEHTTQVCSITNGVLLKQIEDMNVECQVVS